jgi:hypothetical protein
MKRAHSSAKLSIVRDAIDVLHRRLLVMPSTPEVEALRQKAGEFHEQTDSWIREPPPAEERERLMKQVLKLHVDLAKLERDMQPQ